MERDDVRRRLEQERDQLQQTRSTFDDEHFEDESEEESTSELSSLDQHPADTGTDTFEREKDLSILERVEAELTDVEHALQRLDEGTYGTCEACGRSIDEARLEALPASRFCLDDQATAEREARSVGPIE